MSPLHTGAAQSKIGADFQTVLPRLVCAYEQGRLVPFVGAGLSSPACRLWQEFVTELEKQAGLERTVAGDKPDALVMRANKAIGRLRALGTPALAEKVRAALFTEKLGPPPQTKALCRLCWPLVLTTNYDDCLAAAFEEAHPHIRMTICGRKPDDAQYVLNALYEPADPILWALQGYLGGPFTKMPGDKFATEIVVGHEEYRKVAHAEPHFRRAFAEVFRSRSMLFIGSGLREPYFREMFSEILETYGPCKQPHYAFVKRGELDPEFMATHFQIFVLEYDEHSTVPQWLDDLACAVEQNAFRQTPVSFAWRKAEINDSRAPCSRLSVMRDPLPESIGEKECLAVSAGGSGPHFFFGKKIQGLLQRLGTNSDSIEDLGLKFVSRFKGKPAFAVRARDEGDKRALWVVGAASTEFFDTAWKHGYRRILMQLLAAGAKRAHPFSARFSLAESVRAFGAWCRKHPDRELELAIYVLNRPVYLEITSGRLDLNELLSSRDLRFWTNVVYPDGEMRRQMWLAQDSATIGDLTDWLGLDPHHWRVESIPRIGSAEKAGDNLGAISGEQLKWHVIPGGTLHFTTLEDIAMH